MYTDILVPLDGSKFAEDALPHAATLAKKFNARVTVVFVLEQIIVFPAPTAAGGVIGMPIDIEAESTNAEGYLACKVDELKTAGINAEFVIRQGDAASEIVDYANETAKDLIVMSTHGRSGIGRWVFGSVADRVLREAHCPVLLIRSNVKD